MNQKLFRLFILIKQDAGLYLGIALGIYLFILFFQPYPYSTEDFNNLLLFLAGLATIIYISLVFIRIFLRWVIMAKKNTFDDPFIHSGVEEFLIWLISSVSTCFYLRYVGMVPLTFYLVFKVALICMIPPVFLRLYDRMKFLRQENESLLREKNSLQQSVFDHETEELQKAIELHSDNLQENSIFQLSDIVLIRSADNYVELVCLEGTEIKKRIIRSTLKSVESQLSQFPSFIRCHRTSIINKTHILGIHRTFSSYTLRMRGINENVPVSRQYLYKIRDLLQNR